MIITEYNVRTEQKTSAVFAFVSDIHECDTKPALDALQKIKPDALLIGGDYVHDDERCEKGFSFLSSAASLLPVFCSLGNHDGRVSDIRKKTADTGAVLLDNEDAVFCGARIGGLTSAALNKNGGKNAQPDLEWLNRFAAKDGFKLLLCHHPEYYDKYIKPLKIDLTLCGHAHGGQWRFFGRGLYAPGQGIFPKYTSGMYDGRLIVSRGLGNPHKIPRINNEPEFITVRLGD